MPKMQTAAEAQDLEALSDTDLEFHTARGRRVSHSPRLQRMHRTLMVETRMCLTALQGTYQVPEDQVAEHRRIGEAIAARDTEGLVSAVEAHMEEALDRLVSGEAAERATA